MMKIISLIILFSISVYAQFKLDIPKTITPIQLENIVKNGWNESNKTLNDLIVTNAESLMPEILKGLQKPILKGNTIKNIIDPMPKLLLYRDDYYFIFSYVKYLEFIEKSDNALNIYVVALQGLNNIEDKTMLSMIFRIVNEDIILTTFNKKYFTATQIRYLKNKLEIILLNDTQILWDALERDRKGTVKELQNGLLIKTKVLNSKNRSLNQKIIDKFSNIKYRHDKEFYSLMTEEELFKFDNKYKEVSDKITNKYLKWETNKLQNISEKNVVNLVASYIFIIGNPKLINIKLDLWKSIKRNRKFLEQLKN